MEGKIEFNNYSVKYREEVDFVLQNITFSIESGEKVIDLCVIFAFYDSFNALILMFKDRNSWTNRRR